MPRLARLRVRAAAAVVDRRGAAMGAPEPGRGVSPARTGQNEAVCFN